MQRTILITLTLIICFCLPISGQQMNHSNIPQEKEIVRKFDSLFTSEIEKMGSNIPGIAVAVINSKDILWSKTFGYSDKQKSRTIDAATIFSIQSMGKTVTTIAILLAVQDGLLDLDKPIKEYLPDFKVNSRYDKSPAEVITIRHLLNHRAGFTFEAPLGSTFTTSKNFTEHIESISDTWLRYPVGTRYAYSNVGMDLAAYILQVRTGIKFEKYVEQRIFDKIGMKNSSLDFDKIEKIKNRALPYSGQYPLRIPMLGAGPEYMSLNDMIRYLQFFLNKGVVNGVKLLRQDLLQEMYKIQYPLEKQRSGDGINFEIEPVCDSFLAYKLGRGYGFSSNMIIYPEKDLGIFLLTNEQDLDNKTLLSSMTFKGIIEDVFTKVYGPTPVDPSGIESMKKLNNDDERVKSVLGVYGPPWDNRSISYKDGILSYGIGERYLPLSFYDENGELVGMVGKYSEIRFLTPYHQSKRPSLMQIHRAIGSRGRHVFEYNYGPNDSTGPDKKEWANYIGTYCRYKLGELQDSTIYKIEVKIRNGYLTMRDMTCEEYLPGLFFTFDGECFDLASEKIHYKNIPLKKVN